MDAGVGCVSPVEYVRNCDLVFCVAHFIMDETGMTVGAVCDEDVGRTVKRRLDSWSDQIRFRVHREHPFAAFGIFVIQYSHPSAFSADKSPLMPVFYLMQVYRGCC